MFVTLSVAAMLSMAANSSDALEQARTVYGECIVENTISNLGVKTSEDAFSKTLKSVCQAEQQVYFKATVAYEIGEGASKKEAADIAKEEIEMMIEDSVVTYAEHLEANTTPTQEG